MILVTGGTGLVGSHLLFSLVSKGHLVKALKRKTSDIGEVRKVFLRNSSGGEDLFGKIEWIEGDILDYFSIEPHLKGVDIIYHCAAVVSFEKRQHTKIIQNNVEGTANLINAAIICGVKRFCHVSSIAALGNTGDGSLVTEDSVWIPSGKNSGYAESKFYSEAEVWRGVEEGVDAVIVHPSIIIGPGKWNTNSCRFFPMIYNGLRFYTSGGNGYVDVRDVAEALVILTDKENFNQAKNQKFILSAENLGYREFFNLIADSMHKPRPAIRATGVMLYFARVVSSFISLVSGKETDFGKATLSSAVRKKQFDGSKITRLFGFRYRTVREAIQFTTGCFLQETNH